MKARAECGGGPLDRFRRFPRTLHLEGSEQGPEDGDLASIPFRPLLGKRLVIEEKMDGENVAVSFGADGALLIQSRGHYLTFAREDEFRLADFHRWAEEHSDVLLRLLGRQYVLFGEWMQYARRAFYDALPDLFLAFDVLDRESGMFLSTIRRDALLRGSVIAQVPRLADGVFYALSEVLAFSGPSRCRTPRWRHAFDAATQDAGIEPNDAEMTIDLSDEMEGLYIRHEDENIVHTRLKWVRPSTATPRFVEQEARRVAAMIENRLIAD